jgi:hypothetical protein
MGRTSMMLVAETVAAAFSFPSDRNRYFADRFFLLFGR